MSFLLNRRPLLYVVAGVTAAMTGVALLSIPGRVGTITASHGLVFVCSFLLFLIPFRDHGRSRPRLVRVAFMMAAIIACAWSLIGFTLLFASRTLSPQMQKILWYIMPIFAGMALGILILLVISGELFTTSSRPTSVDTSADVRKDRKGSEPSIDTKDEAEHSLV